MKYLMYIGEKYIGEYTTRKEVLDARRAIMNRTRYKNKNVCVRRIKGMRYIDIRIVRVNKRMYDVFRCQYLYNRFRDEYPCIYPWWYRRMKNDWYGRYWYEV